MLALVLGAAVLLLTGAALAPGRDTHRTTRFGVKTLAPHTSPADPLGVRIAKVYGSNVPARIYGTEIGDLEDQGVNTRGEMISELSPLAPSAFNAPEREYSRYAQRWIATAITGSESLTRALIASNRTRARAAWETTWSDYLHLGAVYGLFEELNRAIDGGAGGLARGGTDPRSTGLNRLEMGLWSGERLRPLVPVATRLSSDLRQLYTAAAHLSVTPLEYALRSHEILEDAQRDFLSGMDVHWSGQGVLGAAAGLAATKEVFHTLEPLISGRENTQSEVRTELLMLSGVLEAIRRRHHGRYPSLSELGSYEHEQLNGYVAGALSALQGMPGVLETKTPTPVPRIPDSPAPEAGESE